MKLFNIILTSTLIIYSCTSTVCVSESVPQTRSQNVCKELKDSVLIFAVFVDVGMYHPWTEFDINTTLDSVRKASRWIEKQAKKSNKELAIKVVNHEYHRKLSFTEKRTRTRHDFDFYNIISGGKKSYSYQQYWIDKVSKYVGKGVKVARSSKLGTRNKIINTERLMSALRDKYKNDNIALMVFVNGYYESHPSITFHSESNGPYTEYSVITNKSPTIIAHEFLHLFGAIDLYPTLRFSNFNFKSIQENFPNEIMRTQHKNISKLNLSPISKYLIGWQDSLDEKSTRMLYHKSELIEY
jgi:hypothetical protein